jgi:Mg2+/Co2+ transporter CorB
MRIEIALLIFLILLNGAFAMSEVALLTARRTRLAELAKDGDRLAAAALKLCEDPTRFLSTIQIGITSIGLLNGIVGEAVFAEPFAKWLVAQGFDPTWSGWVATGSVVVVVTYLSIVVGELVPKRLGQHNAETIARLVAWPMRALAVVSAPFVHLLSGSTNALLKPLLRLLRIQPQQSGAQALSAEEIRTIILESSNFLPKKHVSILLNMFDVTDMSVQDVMLPRTRIESVCLENGMETVSRQLATSHHMRLPVFRNHEGDLAGVLHLRKILSALYAGSLDEPALLEVLDEPYFVPATTPVLSQIQYFQENKERIALVVDEYGELLGLVTLEDIVEEIIGKFTTSLPTATPRLAWDEAGTATAEGAMPVREVNRALGLALPTDGPKTLNGLIVEHLQDLPEGDVSIRVAGVPMEIVHAQGRTVKTVRIFRPVEPVESHETSEA